MRLEALRTPCALVDREAVIRNCRRMSDRALRLGVRLRPHVKTHKCVEVAREQVRGHFGGLTVSTLAEARAMASAGFNDLTWAVPPAPARLGEAVGLAAGLERFAFLVDHPATVAAIQDTAAAHDRELAVWVKIDCGGGRAGALPRSELARSLADAVSRASHLRLAGLLTHAGHAYRCRDLAEVELVAAQERAALLDAAADLGDAGVPVPALSLGSTPTVSVVEDLGGIAEVRPGNYAFYDVFQARLGVCDLADVALTVLATVIGVYPDRGELLVDAGALALSKDPGPVHLDPDCGFGVVAAADGTTIHEQLRVVGLTQEHGLVRAADAAAVSGFAPGARLRILPNHSCLTAACFDRYHVVEGGEVVDEWRPARGW